MSPIKNEEWTQLIVPNSGRVYFYNVTNGESRWDIRNKGGPYDGIKYSNPRPLQSDARVADHAYHNRNYRSLNSAYEYADDQYQKRRRPQYQFMTPPRADRRSRVELGSHPGQHNQVILRPPHTCDAVTTNHRQSYSYANHAGSKWILDKPEESIRRDLLDMYHHHKMQESTKLLADTYEPPKHATGRTTAKTCYVHSLPARNDVESTPQNYNKDYVRLSHDYKRMGKYRVNCESDFRPVCVSCHNEDRSLEKILFPCEHVCICSQCLITSRPKRCPLCQEHIQKILDHNGYEHEEYWKWVEEVCLELVL